MKKAIPKSSYYTLVDFQNDFFTYSKSGLQAIVGGSGNCPKGRFLYENGRKLYPETSIGVPTYMVGVYDPVSFLNGFIDPNSKAFITMNADKPGTVQINDAIHGIFSRNPNGGEKDQGPGVFTLAGCQFGSNVDISGNLTVNGTTTINNVQFGSNIDISGSMSASQLFANTVSTAILSASNINALNGNFDNISTGVIRTNSLIANTVTVIHTSVINISTSVITGQSASFLDYVSTANLVASDISTIALNASNIFGNNVSTTTLNVGASATFQTVPSVFNTSVSSSNDLVPRAYLDNLINVALPAIAGYMPSTCYNLHKNIGKSAGSLTSVSGDGNLYFLYPFIDTPISKIVSVTGTTNLITTATSVGMSLIEYPSLSSLTGVCVATTGNVVGAPYNIWKVANTRYTIPLNSSYVIQAGKKYAVSTSHNNPTTVQLLGFGMGNAAYSIGIPPLDMQTSATYTGGIPAISSFVTMSTVGSGFVVLMGLEP